MLVCLIKDNKNIYNNLWLRPIHNNICNSFHHIAMICVYFKHGSYRIVNDTQLQIHSLRVITSDMTYST